jgi:divalent metal cation (Fe/Co/Zn/Cd) transporter
MNQLDSCLPLDFTSIMVEGSYADMQRQAVLKAAALRRKARTRALACFSVAAILGVAATKMGFSERESAATMVVAALLVLVAVKLLKAAVKPR